MEQKFYGYGRWLKSGRPPPQPRVDPLNCPPNSLSSKVEQRFRFATNFRIWSFERLTPHGAKDLQE